MNTSNPTPLETKLRRIERTSIVLRGVCRAILVAVGFATVVAVAAALTGRLTRFETFGESVAIPDLPLRGRAIVAVVVLLTGAVAWKALAHLHRLLGNYSRREIFTADSARQIRSFGISCILWVVMKVAWAFVPALVLSNRPVSIVLTSDPLAVGFVGAVIVVISWFAEMATALREENELTI